MIKFPSIEQFRTVIRHVQTHTRFAGKDETGEPIYDHSKPLPTLKFQGTVKLHGTNAGIAYNFATDIFTYQSRERELSLTQDNAGFMLNMMANESVIREIIEKMTPDFEEDDAVTDLVLFGEWCGSGIQKGVAISQLPKMFVIFGAKVITNNDTNRWLVMEDYGINYPEQRIFNIHNFPTWNIDIDFKFPEIAQNTMIEITEAVEKCCPVGAYFGVEDGIGEGVVWTCVESEHQDSGTWFKVKGEKHSVSKVKTLAPVDVEAVENMRAFVQSVVTQARLEQGVDNLVREQLKPFEIQSMGDFIRWVYNDVLKEEMDTIVANQIDTKKLGSAIASTARPWFINALNKSA